MYRVYGVWFSMYRVLLIMVLYVQCSTEFGSQCTRFHLVWFSMYNGSNEFGSLCTGFYWVWFSMYMVLLRMYNGVVLVIESKHEETWTLSANNPERAETSASLSFFLSPILSLRNRLCTYPAVGSYTNHSWSSLRTLGTPRSSLRILGTPRSSLQTLISPNSVKISNNNKTEKVQVILFD